MPEMRARGQRIRSGTHAVVDLTSSYAISAIALQTDQSTLSPWVDPNFLRSTIPQLARVSLALDMSSHEDGYYIWSWTFSFMTYDMYNYFRNLAGAVTVMDYTIANDAVYLNAVLLPVREGDSEHAPMGFRNVRFRFVKGVIIT